MEVAPKMSDRNLTKSMDTLFPQIREDWHPDRGFYYVDDSSVCRVCREAVVDGRWNYCSERCRDIANAVQRMFLWEKVRDQVLDRDGHTCQRCGWSKVHISRVKRHVDSDRLEAMPYDDWVAFDRDIPSLHVDHIERLEDGGNPFDETNLRTLCERCHTEKTAAENRGEEIDTEAAAPVSLADYLQYTTLFE